jgi:hypothetical protein
MTPDQNQTAAPAEDPQFIQQVVESPLVKGVMSGDTPPLYAPLSLFGEQPEPKIQQLQRALASVNLGLDVAPKSGAVVLFNPKIYSRDEIMKADESGQLESIAIALEADGAGQAPGASPTQAPSPAPAPAAAGISAGLTGGPAGAPAALAARTQALAPKPPVKQPMPSQGIMNGLLSRAS